VFTAERVTIVCLLSDSPRTFIASIVPTAEVMPGIIETRMPAAEPVVIERIEDFFSFCDRSDSVRFCSGIFGFVANDVRSVGSPKRPERAGKRTGESNPMGDCTGRSNARMPKIPERKKRNVAKIIPTIEGKSPLSVISFIFPFSVAIMRMVIAMRTKSMMSWSVL